jgi:hypothetical protein
MFCGEAAETFSRMGASGKREVVSGSGIGEAGNAVAGLALADPVRQRHCESFP